ncbi:hypothetical protein NVV95_06825 [Herbiconiux sp. CPCC 205716]|uniref:Uncharacterized protein n=1 Tax=Herbiconiux gentiana TaxID=2970912 RepID=A0ABT2GDG2_9MICO|nr:hypothetical protein [Herbiconiux gentiana]MCS5714266.1 hypothetical protein [Herbiconiux gentiana]
MTALLTAPASRSTHADAAATTFAVAPALAPATPARTRVLATTAVALAGVSLATLALALGILTP